MCGAGGRAPLSKAKRSTCPGILVLLNVSELVRCIHPLFEFTSDLRRYDLLLPSWARLGRFGRLLYVISIGRDSSISLRMSLVFHFR